MVPAKHKIDLTLYPRAALLNAFRDREMPCFSVTSEVDVTTLVRYARTKNLKFFITMSYALSRTVNQIPELRQRLIGGELYEFERVDPGYTVLLENNTFSFCDSLHIESFAEYYDHASRAIEAVKRVPDLAMEEKDHMFFITAIPWFSFTSFTHPYFAQYASIPLLTMGKYFHRSRKILMPLAIQVHHAIVDGIHIGMFLDRLGETINDIGAVVSR